MAKATASCRYRIGHFVELVGGADVVLHPRLPLDIPRRCRIISCVRPLVTPALAQTLSQLRQAQVELVGDYDDLLFAGEADGLPESVGGSAGDAAKRARIAAYAAGLTAFTRFTVATRPLARRLSQLAPDARVTLVPNGLSEPWVAQGRTLYRVFRRGDPLVIRYFAGSPSHDRDFDMVIGPLSRFLDAHREVRLEVVGPVRFDLGRFPTGSVAALQGVSYDDLPGLLASTWVNLAPLESNAFNDCKSAIKLLESGAFECPTLASPNDDVLRHQELGAPLSLCRSGQDWYAALEAMLDLQRREALGRGIAEHVTRHGTARSSMTAWLSGLGFEEEA